MPSYARRAGARWGEVAHHSCGASRRCRDGSGGKAGEGVLVAAFQSEREEETRDRAERGSAVRGSDQASVAPKRIPLADQSAMHYPQQLTTMLETARLNSGVDRDAPDVKKHQVNFLDVGSFFTRHCDNMIRVAILQTVLTA